MNKSERENGHAGRVSRASLACAFLAMTLSACTQLRGTGDLGIVIERAAGSVLVVETTDHSQLAQVRGLGDLSHASAVYSRDQRYAYVFGRDGGLTKVDLLEERSGVNPAFCVHRPRTLPADFLWKGVCFIRDQLGIKCPCSEGRSQERTHSKHMT